MQISHKAAGKTRGKANDKVQDATNDKPKRIRNPKRMKSKGGGEWISFHFIAFFIGRQCF